jgi:hypothetical protein
LERAFIANNASIIDWGFAAKVPVQLAGRLPRFLQPAELVLPPSRILQEDRKAYIASLASHSSQAASWMLLIHSAEDVDFRHCLLESMISKGIHRSLASLGWNIPIVCRIQSQVSESQTTPGSLLRKRSLCREEGSRN